MKPTSLQGDYTRNNGRVHRISRSMGVVVIHLSSNPCPLYYVRNINKTIKKIDINKININKIMLTITIQEIKFIQKINGKYPDMSLREIGRRGGKKFGVQRHMATIKKALNYNY